MEEDGALEHSGAFAGIAKNSAGGIYKNGATKPFKKKARVAQMWIDMTGANPHNNQPLICMLGNAVWMLPIINGEGGPRSNFVVSKPTPS
jgi:hypothetical protein